MKKGKDALERFTSDSSRIDGLRQTPLSRNYEVDTDAVAVAIISRLRAECVWFVGTPNVSGNNDDKAIRTE